MASEPAKIVAADIGGTNARFAVAELIPGERPRLGTVRQYRTAEHEGLQSAWRAFARDEGGTLPPGAAIAVAAPIEGQVLRFMNSPWRIETEGLGGKLGLERMLLLNDFGAVAHAIPVLDEAELEAIAGPDGPLPAEGVISVLGPGTGLGVAILVRRGGRTEVIETEGSHIGFAPLTDSEERITEDLRRAYGRASVERLVSGPGLYDIYRSLGGRGFDVGDSAGLWSAALEDRDSVAAAALEHLVKAFGSAAGDLALAHGAMGVAISSALSRRMAAHLRSPLFAGRFIAKGRYRSRMQKVRVRLVTHEEPGLLGAAVAFERMGVPGP